MLLLPKLGDGILEKRATPCSYYTWTLLCFVYLNSNGCFVTGKFRSCLVSINYIFLFSKCIFLFSGDFACLVNVVICLVTFSPVE
ncbi:hypothetical protein EDC94DRAFT_616029, partial [Helicostylum pulchrum]